MLPITNKDLIQNGVKTQSLPNGEYGRIAKLFSGERPSLCALSYALFRCYGVCLNGEAQPSRSFLQAPAIVPNTKILFYRMTYSTCPICYNMI